MTDNAPGRRPTSARSEHRETFQMSSVTQTAYNSPIDRILGALRGRGPVRKVGQEWLARCPAHADEHPSLNVREGRGGVVLVNCRSRRCPFRKIAAALNMTEGDFFPADERRLMSIPIQDRITDRYPYRGADGEVLYEVLRLFPKTFRQRRS